MVSTPTYVLKLLPRDVAQRLVQLAGAGSCVYIVYIAGRYFARRRPGDGVMPIPPSGFSMAVADFYPLAGWPMNPHAHYIPHQRAGKSVLSLVWPLTARRYIYVGDPAATKRILNDRHTWVKQTENYELLGFFGQNIFTTEGDQWLRHRTVARKAFGEKNNALMWTETVGSLQEWFEDWDEQLAAGSSVTVNITDAMRDITLTIIASAGFGMHFGKRSSESRSTRAFDSNKPHSGFKMSFAESLFVAIDTMILKVIVPRFLYALPISYLRKSDVAYDELRHYIRGIIAETRDAIKSTEEGEAADLSRRLIQANDEDDESVRHRLSDDELVANIYMFFIAGHETTAHTLTFAFALLAIHPDIQEKLYQEARTTWPDLSDTSWSTSTLADYNALEYTLAVFRETLRLFPAVVRTGRTTTRDTVLPYEARNPATGEWETRELSVEKGIDAWINIYGLHMDPRSWGEDVEAFRPERFVDRPEDGYEWPRDAWVPFTSGPHVCLGQRFAQVEGVCVMARLLRKYRIRPTLEVAQLPHAEQWKRLTSWTAGATATPTKVDLVFEPRTS